MVYADLHIHVGRSLDGKPVKITASDKMNLPQIITTARRLKGLDLIGIVDSHSNGVRRDFEDLLNNGLLKLLDGGGYEADELIIIPGMESELKVGKGHAHLLAYFPTMAHLDNFVAKLKPYVKNWQLSSQKVDVPPEFWIEAVLDNEGFWVPAHAFTPHKGIYGQCCKQIKDVLPLLPSAVEMGLSADRVMAESISELEHTFLLSNSDAHSLDNIAREYNLMDLTENSFIGLTTLLSGKAGQLLKNYGLHPKMGKYHRTYCPECQKIAADVPPVLSCPACGSQNVVLGVLDRVCLIADKKIKPYSVDSKYVYQVPLKSLPGIGPRKYELLLKEFGSELAVLHQAEYRDLCLVVGEKIANIIMSARSGKLSFQPGGGGIFGKVKDIIS